MRRILLFGVALFDEASLVHASPRSRKKGAEKLVLAFLTVVASQWLLMSYSYLLVAIVCSVFMFSHEPRLTLNRT